MSKALHFVYTAAVTTFIIALVESLIVISLYGALFSAPIDKLRFIVYELALFFLCGLVIGLVELVILEGGGRLLGLKGALTGILEDCRKSPSKRVKAISLIWGIAAGIPIFTVVIYYASLYAMQHFHAQIIMSFFTSLLSMVSLAIAIVLGILIGRIIKGILSATNLASDSPRKSAASIALALPIIFLGCFLALIVKAHYDWLPFAVDFRALPYLILFVAVQAALWRRCARHRVPEKVRAAIIFCFAAIVSLVIILSGLVANTNVLFIAHKSTILQKRVLLCLNRFVRPVTAPGGIKIKEEDLVYQKSQKYVVDRKKLQERTGDTSNMNVLFITVDALRADHLGCYGYKRDTSPNIDKFAKDCVLFENTFIQAADSPNSLSRYFTSHYIADPFNTKEPLTVTQIMKENGYETLAVYDGALWDRYKQGFLRGFDQYLTTSFPYEQVFNKSIGEDINRLALEYLRRRKGRKFFMWTHYLEPHSGYNQHPEIKNFGSENIDAYDSEIAATDMYFGKLIEEIKSLGIYDGTIIVLSADHGEEFKEHGDDHHGRQLYNESMHVPLIIKLPGVRQKRISNKIGVIDFVPTIVQLLNLKTNASFDGQSLIPLIYFNDASFVTPIYSYVTAQRLDAKMIMDGDWKLIYTGRNNTLELYNLKDDPAEKNNLFTSRGDIANQLAMKLLAWIKFELGQKLPKNLAGAQAREAIVEKAVASPGAKETATPGQVSQEAPPGAAKLKHEIREPRGVAIGKDGFLFVTDFGNNCLRKFSPDGRIIETWGKFGNESGNFSNPRGIAIDAQYNIYVADAWNHRIQKFDSAGKFVAQYEASFFAPSGVAVDRQGNIFVADNGHNCVKKLGPDGKLIASIGKKGSAPGDFILPVGLAVTDDGMLYVADSGNRRIQVFDSAGKFNKSIPVDGWTKGVFNLPYIVLDREGSIYITDPLNNRALKLSSKGKLMGVLRPQKDGKDLLSTPTGLALDEDQGLAYIVDTWNHCIRKFVLDEFKPAK